MFFNVVDPGPGAYNVPSIFDKYGPKVVKTEPNNTHTFYKTIPIII